MEWHYAIDGKQQGPLSESQFDDLVRSGVIKPETLVWRQGMEKWQPYASVMVPGGQGGDATEVCAVSGKRYPRREMIQFEGKWISAEHRDEFFQRLREGVTQPGKYPYAGFWQRFCAKFVDGIAIYALTIPVYLLTAYLVFGTINYMGQVAAQAGLQRTLLYQAITLPVGILIGLSYAWFFIAKFDATPGKMALGLKLLRPDGSRLTNGRIIGRHFAEMISSMTMSIGYVMAAFDSERRSLHDRICDTRVFKVK